MAYTQQTTRETSAPANATRQRPQPDSPMNGEQSTPPFKQFVWALGHGTNKVPIGEMVDKRYQVVAPSIWLDTQPDKSPKVPNPVPNFALPYLKAYPYQLNLPGVYGICHQKSGEAVLLLSNVPVNRQGQLMPAIAKAWPSASAFRQAYWLWQQISLWEPLQEIGAAASLLKKSNLRVEAWRLRLIGLSTNPAKPTFKDLADSWQMTYLPQAKPDIAGMIKAVCKDLRSPAPDFDAIKEQINAQLLKAAAGNPLQLQIAGATSTGPTQSRNEDACYPSKTELDRTGTADLPLLPRLAIVCDGVGGHEGGEVASQRVVRSLQLQLRGLLAEAMDQSKTLPPSVVIEQIEAAIRVANNLISQQNDEQARTDRQRMGTTLVLALVLPQRVDTPEGPSEVNELYLTHVGDSRAYWLTTEHCQLLTVDDDIAGREVTAGHSFLTTARQRPDADALSQAIGTREYEHLRPHTQRFLFESSGVLLLCSDGLSDNHQVETAWANYIGLIVKQIVPLDVAVDAWIELANQRNGHDNVAVVLMHAMMSSGDGATLSPADSSEASNLPVVPTPATQPATAPTHPADQPLEPVSPLTPASRALLYGEDEDDDTPLTPEEMAAVKSDIEPEKSSSQGFITGLLAIIVVGVMGVVGWLLWNTLQNNDTQNVAPIEPEAPALEESDE